MELYDYLLNRELRCKLMIEIGRKGKVGSVNSQLIRADREVIGEGVTKEGERGGASDPENPETPPASLR